MKRFKYYLPFVLTIVFLFSCEEKLEDLNVDPNNPSQISPQVALPAGIASVGSVVGGRFAILGGIWSQYYTQNNASNQYKDLDAFYFTPGDFDIQWQELYAGGLNDLEYVKDQAAKTQDWGLYLMATVLQTYTFHVTTDIFGDIPFSEALRAEENISEPKFEESEAIYDSLIMRLDNALAKDLNAETVTDPGSADFLFDGNLDKWVQFANTLKLKIYLRYAEKEPSKAASGIQALYASGAEFLSEDAAMNEFEDQASKSNPFFEMDKRQLNTANNLKASKTLFSLLDQTDDPRLYQIYDTAQSRLKPATDTLARYAAMDQGNFNATSTALPPLTISTAKVTATAPVYFISEEESYFLQAEAVVRGWGTGDAKELYEKAVRTSMSRLTISPDLLEKIGDDTLKVEERTTFLLNDNVNIGNDGAYAYETFFGGGLAAILMQKWIALAGTYQGIEAFFDRMRTGYPQESDVYSSDQNYKPGYVVYPKEGTTSGVFATRLFLPDVETTRNPDAPDQAKVTDPMWWHKP